jgi:hypothetical protein
MVRMPVMRLRQLSPLIQNAGLQISRELGYQTMARTGYRAPLRANGAAEGAMAKASLQTGRGAVRARL